MDNRNDTDVSIAPSSGSVFADIGLHYGEEDMAKISIARIIASMINQKNITQSEAADLIGIDQPKVSMLLRGKLDAFSIERLLSFLVRLGSTVDINISSSLSSPPGRINVRAA